MQGLDAVMLHVKGGYSRGDLTLMGDSKRSFINCCSPENPSNTPVCKERLYSRQLPPRPHRPSPMVLCHCPSCFIYYLYIGISPQLSSYRLTPSLPVFPPIRPCRAIPHNTVPRPNGCQKIRGGAIRACEISYIFRQNIAMILGIPFSRNS